MEVFSLLKYWRTSGGATTTDSNSTTNFRSTAASSTSTTTTTTTIRRVAEEDTEDDDDEDYNANANEDEGPFFDLEFAVPDQECGCEVVVSEDSEEEEEDNTDSDSIGEAELDFTVDSSCSTGNRTDPNQSMSPSDDLFFNSRFVPLEPSELVFNSSEQHSISKLQFPTALLKPATKLRVLMLGFKKPKSLEKIETRNHSNPKPFTVKFKVEEVPIVSLFTRENSSRNHKKQSIPTTTTTEQNNSEEMASTEEKKFAKDVLQKYLNMVKPLYFKVSKKPNTSTTGFSGQLNLNSVSSPVSSPTKKIDGESKETEVNVGCVRSSQKENIIRNVRKHLGKSRSASSAVAAVPSTVLQSRRHDDSLLQQQDGIQSAILHCKRSFTASRDSSELSRCASDPTHEKTTKSGNSSRTSLDETRTRNVTM